MRRGNGRDLVSELREIEDDTVSDQVGGDIEEESAERDRCRVHFGVG